MNDNIIGSIILEGAPNTTEDTIIVDGGSAKRVTAEATLQDMDVENRNHRIYAKKDLEPEINGPRMRELINAGYMCSELGHPLSDDLVRQQTIDPKLICTRFSKIWVEGNIVKGQYKGTNNEYGEMIDKDLRDGYKPAFSLRAFIVSCTERKRAKKLMNGSRQKPFTRSKGRKTEERSDSMCPVPVRTI